LIFQEWLVDASVPEWKRLYLIENKTFKFVLVMDNTLALRLAYEVSCANMRAVFLPPNT
jgi:hypothetical protein